MFGSLWGVIIPAAATPTGVFLLRQYMLTIPDELLEAARMEAAGPDAERGVVAGGLSMGDRVAVGRHPVRIIGRLRAVFPCDRCNPGGIGSSGW